VKFRHCVDSFFSFIETFENSQNQPAHDPFSIFEHFGFGGHSGGRGREEARTPNVEIPVRVSLRQLYQGDVLEASYTRQVLCVEASSCEKNDKDCQGPGVKMRVQQIAPGFVQQVQVSFSSACLCLFFFSRAPFAGVGSKLCRSRQILEVSVQTMSKRNDRRGGNPTYY
jgi:DnaJ-class molecular chaperone